MREKEEVVVGMDRASEELERRSRYLGSLIKQQRKKEEEEEQQRQQQQQQQQPKQEEEEEDIPDVVVVEQLKATKIDDERKDKVVKQNNKMVEKKKQQQLNVRIRASDMPPELQKRAFRCALEALDAMPKLDSKHLALTLKKEFDSSYGPAWHCIVGTSFGSYVTYSLGGFLYFSIDKVYILLFRTAVEPLDQ